jgi:hypothetical protein
MGCSTAERLQLFQAGSIRPISQPKQAKGGPHMPRLTEYLLKLATDAGELHKYRKLRAEGHGHLHEYLTQQPYPGLTKHQAEVVNGHDTRKVVDAVIDELEKESSRPDNAFYGIGVTIISECNNHVQLVDNGK